MGQLISVLGEITIDYTILLQILRTQGQTTFVTLNTALKKLSSKHENDRGG